MPEPFSTVVDIAMTPDGDLDFEKGDLKLVSGIDWYIQEVNKILRTINPEWINHPNIGAGLEEFVGQPNTRETALAIAGKIRERITAENLNIPFKLRIRPVPISRYAIEFIIFLEADNETIPVSRALFDITGVKGVEIRDPTTEPTEEVKTEASQTGTDFTKSPFLSRLR